MDLNKVSIAAILNKKSKREKIKMLTAYDYSFARLIDQCGVDLILVGDSLANVVLGLDSTREVGMPEMLHHAKAVCRAVQKAIVIGDMPYGSYKTKKLAVSNSQKFIEAGCNAVKIEWFSQCDEIVRAIHESGIAVMGHVGLTPQTADNFQVQGKDAESAKAILNHAKIFESCGCFSIVLECIPSEIARIITDRLKIPTIGIGAGVYCDGQVLVTHDVLGLYDRFRPKFAKRYINLDETIKKSLMEFCSDVEKGIFPDRSHSFSIESQQLDRMEL